MNKLRLFVENFVIYGLGGIISKLVPLLMVPIITRLMPDSSYYGLSDLSNTLVSFGSAIAVMGMYDAMYRMFFEKDDEDFKKNICSTAFGFTLITSVIVFFVMLLFRNTIAKYFFGDTKYAYLVYLSAMATLVGATNQIISAPTRMQNKRKIFLVANILSPVLSYSISIPLLLKGYYIIALPIAAVISGLTLEISYAFLNHRWFQFKRFDIELLKPLLIIAIPLLPNFLIYWVFNSCDKVMIVNYLGTEASGIYSVGSKLGHCSQLIYTAFAGGWQYFAFSTMKEDNQVESNSKVFEYLGVISFCATALMSALSFSIFKILFTSQYLKGYIVAPYLFMAPLLQMLFQVACNQFVVIKKTWPNMLILTSGAIINVFMNIMLIPRLGIEGASIATLFGYIVSDVVCVAVLIKMKLMIISTRFITASGITVLYMVVWRLFFREKVLISVLFAIIMIFIFAYLYRNELSMIYSSIKKRRH